MGFQCDQVISFSICSIIYGGGSGGVAVELVAALVSCSGQQLE